ncbi:MAG TPA: transposase [Verrucomicrobiota bacterium]|nr:transposase [Verrucomicrobiota bacterium]HRZ35102.1 transposase [Candidatus Paceibacterota bacterium]
MARIKVSGRGAVYHCISRVVGGQMLLGPPERDKLQEMLWQQAAFSGIEIVTYCLMANHIHLLLRVPAKFMATDAELVERALALYGKNNLYAQTLRTAFEKQGGLPKDLREGLRLRIGDVSEFMKELKQRFSKWFNRQQNRCGTLWAERFKSVLVEDRHGAVQAVAAYLDLNPVRAGLVKDPKDYRWCGYAEAVAGNASARTGLASFHPSSDWAEAARDYQQLLLVTDAGTGESGKPVLERKKIRQKFEKNADLALGQVLRLRVRYFSDGVVLGSRDYVNEIFGEYRDRFGPRRRSGARPMRGLPSLENLATMRDLQVNVVS